MLYLQLFKPSACWVVLLHTTYIFNQITQDPLNKQSCQSYHINPLLPNKPHYSYCNVKNPNNRKSMKNWSLKFGLADLQYTSSTKKEIFNWELSNCQNTYEQNIPNTPAIKHIRFQGGNSNFPLLIFAWAHTTKSGFWKGLHFVEFLPCCCGTDCDRVGLHTRPDASSAKAGRRD